MKRYTALFLFAVLLLSSGMLLSAADAGGIDPELQQALSALSPDEEISVIVKLSDKADVTKFKREDKGRQRADIVKALKDKAEKTQGPIRAFLEKKKTKKLKQLWIINGIAASVSASLVDDLANFPGVETVTLDAVIHAPVTTVGTAAAPEWNISAVHAPDLWNLGYTGQGIVVANMDTGVDYLHQDLNGRWRGGTNSWFDPNGEHPLTPYDANGHGTGTMGIMVGGDAGGTSIGVAPGAQWIAVKIFNDADTAAWSVIHQGFQWLLDPDGNPDTDDAPDVVNNSWGLGYAGGCSLEFQSDIQALKAANIAMVFAAGNDGPASSTSESPANYPESFAVGAVRENLTIDYSSSRGPSACDGSIFPEVVAPGVNIKTSDLTFGGLFPDSYAYVSGTSFAAPHVAGAMALLLSAFPGQSVAMIEMALIRSATDLGAVGADNDYGNGLLNILGAYRFLRTDRISAYLDGMWYTDRNGNGVWDGTPTDISYYFGFAGVIPVTGNWNGSGTTKIGVYDPATSTWYLDMNGNGIWDGMPTDSSYYFGFAGVVPVTGDWNGSGTTKIGVYDPATSTWYLDYNGNGIWDGTPTDKSYWFGFAGVTPVTGDWDGLGTAKIGVFDPATSTWYLDYNGNGIWDGAATDKSYYFGFAGAIPVTGNWNGSGTTKIGVYDPATSTWYLDMNSNGAWDGTSTDTSHWFGFSGVFPVSGKW